MSLFGTNMQIAIGQVFLNGDMTAIDNPVASTLGISQSTTTANNLWLALFTGNPGETGASNECNSSGTNYEDYQRVPISRIGSTSTPPTTTVNKWQLSTSGDISVFTNLDPISFAPCGAVGGAVVKYWGLFDASTGGNLISYGPLVASGASWKIGMAADTSTYDITARSHGMVADDPILVVKVYGGQATLPTGLAEGTTYYVVASGLATNVFRVSTSVGGATLAISNVGPFLFIKSASITVTSGGIPTIPAGAIAALRIT